MENLATPPPAPPKAENALRTLRDLQRALGDAASLGFIDNDAANPKRLRTGFWLAQRLCRPGWTKRHEKFLKSAYIAGYDFAVAVGRGAPRKTKTRKHP